MHPFIHLHKRQVAHSACHIHTSSACFHSSNMVKPTKPTNPSTRWTASPSPKASYHGPFVHTSCSQRQAPSSTSILAGHHVRQDKILQQNCYKEMVALKWRIIFYLKMSGFETSTSCYILVEKLHVPTNLPHLKQRQPIPFWPRHLRGLLAPVHGSFENGTTLEETLFS